VLVGLPLPERPVAPAGSARSADPRTVAARTAVARTVVVRPGDCLWSIAARELPPDTSARAVTERWRAIYAANRNVIGPDPDRLVAGLRLVVPPDPVSSVHRKDRS
jgi:nucleoid-associated protein YgaU